MTLKLLKNFVSCDENNIRYRRWSQIFINFIWKCDTWQVKCYSFPCEAYIIIYRQCHVKRNKKNAKVMLGRKKRLESWDFIQASFLDEKEKHDTGNKNVFLWLITLSVAVMNDCEWTTISVHKKHWEGKNFLCDE